MHRFVVQDKIGLKLITVLFNGNLVLPSRVPIFFEFLEAVNILLNTGRLRISPVTSISRTVLPTLYDG